jgi:hypothetical protein
LVLAEAFVIVGDVVRITLWYVEVYLLRLVAIPFISALKLKVEFMILNQLTSIGKRRGELRNFLFQTMKREKRCRLRFLVLLNRRGR